MKPWQLVLMLALATYIVLVQVSLVRVVRRENQDRELIGQMAENQKLTADILKLRYGK